MNAKTVDALETVCVLVAITLGLVPLAQRLFGAEQGAVFRRVFGALSDPMTYVVPAVVILAAIVSITVLEAVKRRD